MYDFETGSTTELYTALASYGSVVILFGIGAIIGVALLLVGAGWGWRLFKRKVTGGNI